MTKDELIAKPKRKKKECNHTWGVSAVGSFGITFLSYFSRNLRQGLTFHFKHCPDCGRKLNRELYE